MSTQDLIKTFPLKESEPNLAILLIIGFMILAISFFSSNTTLKRTFISLSSVLISLIFFFYVLFQVAADNMEHIKAKSDWRSGTYLTYISGLDKVEEEIDDFNVNEDGSYTAVTVGKDQTLITYERIEEKKLSTTGKNFVTYVYLSGLESIGIPEGKESLTIHLIPEE